MLLFMDGMAHYDSSRLGLKYTEVDTTNCVWAIVAEGRFGNCIRRTTTGVTNFGHLSISPLMTRAGTWTPSNSGVCGFAIKVDDLMRLNDSGAGVMPEGQEFFTVLEGGAAHVGVFLNPTGTFSLWRSRFTSSFDKLAESIEGLQSAAWAYVEFKWLIDATAGNFQLRVNGVTVLNFTGNTKGSRYGTEIGIWNTVNLLGVEAENTGTILPVVLRACDLYLADLTAPDADDVHDFLGDGIVDTIMPNGGGASTGWAPTGAAQNWDTQNDRPAPDDDGTYVRVLAPGAKDSYQFEDIPPGSVVKGAQLSILARKEEEGSSAVAPVARQGATDYQYPTQGVASIAYDRYLTQPMDLNPATMAPWTDAEINAGQWGVVKVT